jgi:hypothetical protein
MYAHGLYVPHRRLVGGRDDDGYGSTAQDTEAVSRLVQSTALWTPCGTFFVSMNLDG